MVWHVGIPSTWPGAGASIQGALKPPHPKENGYPPSFVSALIRWAASVPADSWCCRPLRLADSHGLNGDRDRRRCVVAILEQYV